MLNTIAPLAVHRVAPASPTTQRAIRDLELLCGHLDGVDFVHESELEEQPQQKHRQSIIRAPRNCPAQRPAA